MTTLHSPYSQYPFSSYGWPTHASSPPWGSKSGRLGIPQSYMASGYPSARRHPYCWLGKEDDEEDDEDDEDEDDQDEEDEDEDDWDYDDDEDEDDEEDEYDTRRRDAYEAERHQRRRKEEERRRRRARSTTPASSSRRSGSRGPRTTTPGDTEIDLDVSVPTADPTALRDRRRKDNRLDGRDSRSSLPSRPAGNEQGRQHPSSLPTAMNGHTTMGLDGKPIISTTPDYESLGPEYLMSGANPDAPRRMTTTPASTSAGAHPIREPSSRSRSRPASTSEGEERRRPRTADTERKAGKSRHQAGSGAPESTKQPSSRSKGEGDTAAPGKTTRDTKAAPSKSSSKTPRSDPSRSSSSSAPRKVDERWKQLARRTSTATSLFDLSSSLYGMRAEDSKNISQKSQTWITEQARRRLAALKLDENTDLSTALSTSAPADLTSKITLESLAGSLLKPMRDYRTQKYTKALKGDDASAKSKAEEGMKREQTKYAAAMKSVQGLAKTLASASSIGGTGAGQGGRKLLYKEVREFIPRDDGREDVTITRTHTGGPVEVHKEVRDTPPGLTAGGNTSATDTKGGTAGASAGTQTVDDFVLNWWKDKMSTIA